MRVERHAGVGRNEPESGRVNESPPGQRFTSDLLSRESLADRRIADIARGMDGPSPRLPRSVYVVAE